MSFQHDQYVFGHEDTIPQSSKSLLYLFCSCTALVLPAMIAVSLVALYLLIQPYYVFLWDGMAPWFWPIQRLPSTLVPSIPGMAALSIS